METELKKVGQFVVAIIPEFILTEIGLRPGDKVDLQAVDGKLLVAKTPVSVRAGWAEDAARIAAAGEQDFGGDEFAGGDDLDWTS